MRRQRFAATIVAVAVSGCATSTTPRIIAFPETQSRPALHINGIFTHSGALATIGFLFERELRFPAFSATLFFYPDAQAVEAALLASGHEPALARDGAARLRAIAAHQRVIINERKMRDLDWPDQVASLAHELVHCLQYDLGGGRRGTSEQWLREGFAEWVALRLLEQLRVIEPDQGRRMMIERLRSSDTARAPRLDEMMTFPQWVAVAGIPGIAPQAQATLAVDALITAHGIPAVLAYFKRFATTEDPDVNFLATFGVDRASFEQSFNAARGLRRSGRTR